MATNKITKAIKELFDGFNPTDSNNDAFSQAVYGQHGAVSDSQTATEAKINGDNAQLIRNFPIERLSQYPIVEKMVKDPIIGSAIQMHLSHALSVKNKTGEVVFFESTDGKPNKYVDDINKNLAKIINNNIIKWGYLTSIYGYYPVRVYGESGRGVTSIVSDYYTNPRFIREFEKGGNLSGFAHRYHKAGQEGQTTKLMNPWKFVSFKIPYSVPSVIAEPVRLNQELFDIDNDDPMSYEAVETQDYGQSLLEPAYDPWMDLNDATISLNASRQNAAKRDRFIGVHVGKDDPIKAAKLFNTMATQLQRKAKESARRSIASGFVSTVDNFLYPIHSNGSGQTEIQTEQSSVDVSAIEDVNFHVNRVASALGVDKSLLGFTEDLSGGLGDGGFFRTSLIAAIKANMIRVAMHMGIERIAELHVAYKHNKVFTKEDKPWKTVFNSLSSAIEAEEAATNDSKVQYATSVVSLMTLLNPDMGRFDFDKSVIMVFSKLLGMDESEINNIIVTAGSPDTLGDNGAGLENTEDQLDDLNNRIEDAMAETSDDKLQELILDVLQKIAKEAENEPDSN